MSELFTKISAWVKANMLLALGILAAVIFLLFPRQLKRMFVTRRRIKHRPGYSQTHDRKGRLLPGTKSGRRLPRSVGRKGSSAGKGYPAAAGGYIPFKYNKDGTIKKAWQVGGTVAAKNRMRGLRRKR